MKTFIYLVLPAIAVFGTGRLTAQTTEEPSAPATADASASVLPDTPVPAPGSTVITSEELRMDQVAHVAVFTGHVVATGTNFVMKCEEMTVNFDKAGKVDTILSKGNVVVTQPGRVTHSGQAEYYRDDDKFVLTDQPVIVDNKNTIYAPIITIYRTKQSLYTSGGPSTVILPPGAGAGSSATAGATGTDGSALPNDDSDKK